MTFYLQSDGHRAFLDASVHKDCTVIREIEADNWKDARDQLTEEECR